MFLAVLQAIFGLAVTLGLVGLAAYAARRWGPSGMFQLRPAGERRLAIVESLNLDPSRRLVLVRFDQEERLLLLGEGRMLDARPAPAQPSPAKPVSLPKA
jgi:flagellar protein FliO/FliZ